MAMLKKLAVLAAAAEAARRYAKKNPDAGGQVRRPGRRLRRQADEGQVLTARSAAPRRRRSRWRASTGRGPDGRRPPLLPGIDRRAAGADSPRPAAGVDNPGPSPPDPTAPRRSCQDAHRAVCGRPDRAPRTAGNRARGHKPGRPSSTGGPTVSVPQPWIPESVPTPEHVVAGLHATDEGGADLVQLLTPEGERVPRRAVRPYAADIGVAELQGLYRDMVLVRRFDREANALQRQGQLGIWVPLLGQEAAQIGAGRALAPQDMAFPSYREHGVAWCRGIDPTELLGIFRGTDQGGWDSRATRFHLYTIVIGNQCLNATGYAMGQKFESKVGDGARRRGHHVLLRRRRHQPGRRPRGLRLGRGLRRARRLLLPEQPVGHLRAHRAADPRAALQARAGLRLPRHPRRRQRRARLPRRHPLGARGVPHRQRAGARRGVHLPDGRAHHVRRPHPLPPRRRAGAVEAEGPDRTGAGAPRPVARGGAGVLRRDRGRGRRARRAVPAVLHGDARARAGADVLRGLRGGVAAGGGAARRLPGLPRVVRDRGSLAGPSRRA